MMYTLSLLFLVLQLVDEAWHRWQAEDAANADDVTAVVVAFTHSA